MPSRRDVLKSITAGAGLAVGGSTLTTAQVQAAFSGIDVPEDVNILMLVLDDQNDWVGHLGNHPQAITPNIDRLADSGVAFQHAYCAIPACNPSRVATMSGLLPNRTDMYWNNQDGRAIPQLVDYFRSLGYSTRRAGKIFHREWAELPTNSWDEVFFEPWVAPEPATIPATGEDVRLPWGELLDAGPNTLQDQDMQSYRFALRVADFLQQPQQQPFLMCYGCSLPHKPWYVPQSHFDLFPLESIELPLLLNGDLDDLPSGAAALLLPQVHQDVVAAGAHAAFVQGYLASSHFADVCIGVILDALEQSPAKDDTIVVLWSDHGLHLGEKEHWAKQTLYESALRVPFIFRCPGATPAGQRCHQPVGLVDLFPTLCELTQTPTPPDLDGRSLVPLLQQPSLAWGHPVFSMLKDSESVRSNRWRYSRYLVNGEWQEELYDLLSDPEQFRNLAGNDFFDAVKQEHIALLQSPTQGTDIPCGSPSINSASDGAAFLWRVCNPTNQWHFLVAGNSGQFLECAGNIVCDQPFTSLTPVNIETPSDFVTQSSSTRIDFRLRAISWHDGFNFTVPQGAGLTITFTSGTPLFTGPNRDSVSLPLMFVG